MNLAAAAHFKHFAKGELLVDGGAAWPYVTWVVKVRRCERVGRRWRPVADGGGGRWLAGGARWLAGGWPVVGRWRAGGGPVAHASAGAALRRRPVGGVQGSVVDSKSEAELTEGRFVLPLAFFDVHYFEDTSSVTATQVPHRDARRPQPCAACPLCLC